MEKFMRQSRKLVDDFDSFDVFLYCFYFWIWIIHNVINIYVWSLKVRGNTDNHYLANFKAKVEWRERKNVGDFMLDPSGCRGAASPLIINCINNINFRPLKVAGQTQLGNSTTFLCDAREKYFQLEVNYFCLIFVDVIEIVCGVLNLYWRWLRWRQ